MYDPTTLALLRSRSGGGVSSWNDLTDKPFYEGPVMVEVLAECQPPYDANMEGFVLANSIPLEVGKAYVVNWNGTEYACTAQEYVMEFTAVALGNVGGFTGGNDTGEPFAIVSIPSQFVADLGMGGLIKADDYETQPTLSITTKSNVIRPIDGKFLPKGTPWIGEGVLFDEVEATEYTHPSLGKAWEILKAPDLKAGENYTIFYNGAPFECVCQPAPAGFTNDGNAVSVGNFAVAGGEDTGEPFAMLISQLNQRVDIIDLSGASSVRVKICGTTTHKLDNRCLDFAWIPSAAETEILSSRVVGHGEPEYGLTSEAIANSEYANVYYDGVKYTCKVYDVGAGAYGLGNVGSLAPDIAPATDDPFVIAVNADCATFYGDQNPHTYRITTLSFERMPNMFMPAGWEAPYFNLYDMGLKAIVPGEVASVETDTTELWEALISGATKIYFLSQLGVEGTGVAQSVGWKGVVNAYVDTDSIEINILHTVKFGVFAINITITSGKITGQLHCLKEFETATE